MPNTYFSFKQFTIHHDRCAMKVGTDGVLLGAWTDISTAQRILDIGTGTGLIALMLAQRSQASITAIDIDRDAVEQACENAAASPWGNRINISQQDICHYKPEHYFDVIVSNPPYFINALKCPDNKRNRARHTDDLSFEDLITHAANLLSTDGIFSVIIPTDGMSDFLKICECNQLYLYRQTLIHTIPNALPKRVLLAFKKDTTECIVNHLTIELSRHIYSDEYIALTKDFYLNM